jgi:hypothetical protein
MIGLYHVPRTGGTALQAAMKRAGINYVASHNFAEVDAAHPDTIVTLLREPRSRLLSEFLFRHNLTAHSPGPGRAGVWTVTGTLCDWVDRAEPVYPSIPAVAVVGITERLGEVARRLGCFEQLRWTNELMSWPRYDIGGCVAELCALLNERTLLDAEIYRDTLAGRGPHPDATFNYTLTKYHLNEQRVAA